MIWNSSRLFTNLIYQRCIGLIKYNDSRALTNAHSTLCTIFKLESNPLICLAHAEMCMVQYNYTKAIEILKRYMY